MTTATATAPTPDWPSAPGEMAGRIRAHPWAATPLGAIETWPDRLRAVVDFLLVHDLPMVALLGGTLVQLYNDRYRGLMGAKHPAGLGQPTRDCWPEVWHINEPVYARVLAGESVTFEDKLFPIARHGIPEDAWFTLTYSPLRTGAAKSAGGVDGVFVAVVETSAKMRAEAARRDSERRLAAATAGAGLSGDFRALFEAAPAPLMVLAVPGFTVAAANDAWLRATLTQRDWLLGRHVFDAFPDDPADPAADGVRNLRASLERVVATGQADAMAVQRYPIRRPASAGGGFEERWWACVNSPVPGADGAVALVVHRGEDVTARRQAEAALAASEARFRLVADALPQIVWIADSEGRVEFLNRVWEDYTGVPYEATTAAAVAAGFVHPDDGAATLAAFAEAQRTGATFEVEHRIRGRTGKYRWFLVRAEPHRDPQTGEVVRWFGSSTDIHGRRGTEARLAALVTLGDRLRDAREPPDVPATVAEVIGHALEGLRAGYGTLNAAETVMTITHDWAAPGIPSVVGDWELAGFWSGFADAMRRGETVAVADVATDPRTAADAASYAAVGTRAALHVPLVEGGRVVAMVFAHDAEPRAWSGEEVAFICGVAERTWAAVERVRFEAALRANESRLQVLVHELQHRTLNLMGVVSATAGKLLKTSAGLPEFAARFQSRIGALARVQGLLSRVGEHDRVTFDGLLRSELDAMGAFGAAAGDAVTLEGPKGVRLRSGTVQMLAMGLHELATNAVKYGALHQPGARLSVRWRLEQEGGKPWLHVDWTETGVAIPEGVFGGGGRRGQGRELIERALPYQLKARTRFELGADGVRCTLAVPVSATGGAFGGEMGEAGLA